MDRNGVSHRVHYTEILLYSILLTVSSPLTNITSYNGPLCLPNSTNDDNGKDVDKFAGEWGWKKLHGHVDDCGRRRKGSDMTNLLSSIEQKTENKQGESNFGKILQHYCSLILILICIPGIILKLYRINNNNNSFQMMSSNEKWEGPNDVKVEIILGGKTIKSSHHHSCPKLQFYGSYPINLPLVFCTFKIS